MNSIPMMWLKFLLLLLLRNCQESFGKFVSTIHHHEEEQVEDTAVVGINITNNDNDCHDEKKIEVLSAAARGLGGQQQEVSSRHQPKQHEEEEDGHSGRSLSAPLTGGNIRALIVLVRFPEHADRLLPDKAHFEDLCDGGIGASGKGASEFFDPAFGTAAHYLFQQSSNKYKVTCQVMDWMTTNRSEASSLGGASSNALYAEYSQRLVWGVMDRVEQKLIAQRKQQMGGGTGGGSGGGGGDDDENVGDDWYKVFDTNSDNAFDAFIVIHSGYNSQSEGACDETDSEKRIRSVSLSETPNMGGWKSSRFNINQGGKGGIRISNFMVASAFSNGAPICANDELSLQHNVANMLPIWLKEWVYMIGSKSRLPTLFDLRVMKDTNNAKVGGLGYFDLLCAQGRVMTSLSAYTKIQLGWITDVDVLERDGIYDLEDVNVWGKVLKITKGFKAPGEYVLLENRQEKGYDAKLFPAPAVNHPTRGGVLIYHINEDKGDNSGGRPYRVGILARDGKDDIGGKVNNGDRSDFWTVGDVLLHLQSYTLGSTGISIKFFPNRGSGSTETIEVAVSGISNPPMKFPSPPTTPAPIVMPTATMEKTEAPVNIPTASIPSAMAPRTQAPVRTEAPAPTVPDPPVTTPPPSRRLPTMIPIPTAAGPPPDEIIPTAAGPPPDEIIPTAAAPPLEDIIPTTTAHPTHPTYSPMPTSKEHDERYPDVPTTASTGTTKPAANSLDKDHDDSDSGMTAAANSNSDSDDGGGVNKAVLSVLLVLVSLCLMVSVVRYMQQLRRRMAQLEAAAATGPGGYRDDDGSGVARRPGDII